MAISTAGRTMPRRRASTRSVPDRTLQLWYLCVVPTVSTYGISGDEEHRRRGGRDVGRDRTPRRRHAGTALPDRGRRSAFVPWRKTRPPAQHHRASRCADGAPSRSVDGESDVRSSGSGRTAATSHPALQPGRHGSASTSRLSIQRSPALSVTGGRCPRQDSNLRPRDSKIAPWDSATQCRSVRVSCVNVSGWLLSSTADPGCSRGVSVGRDLAGRGAGTSAWEPVKRPRHRPPDLRSGLVSGDRG